MGVNYLHGARMYDVHEGRLMRFILGKPRLSEMLLSRERDVVMNEST